MTDTTPIRVGDSFVDLSGTVWEVIDARAFGARTMFDRVRCRFVETNCNQIRVKLAARAYARQLRASRND